jgi:hypothetical protein
MHFMTLIILYDFMQVLNSIRKHPTNNEYFSRHILFTTIYLLQEKKLNPRNYYEQELNMRTFIQDNDHDVHMCAKFQDFTFCVLL